MFKGLKHLSYEKRLESWDCLAWRRKSSGMSQCVHFYWEDDRALQQVQQRGCGLSVFKDTQNPSGHSLRCYNILNNACKSLLFAICRPSVCIHLSVTFFFDFFFKWKTLLHDWIIWENILYNSESLALRTRESQAVVAT